MKRFKLNQYSLTPLHSTIYSRYIFPLKKHFPVRRGVALSEIGKFPQTISSNFLHPKYHPSSPPSQWCVWERFKNIPKIPESECSFNKRSEDTLDVCPPVKDVRSEGLGQNLRRSHDTFNELNET